MLLRRRVTDDSKDFKVGRILSERSPLLCHLLLTRVSPHGAQLGPLTKGIATGHALKITTHVCRQVTFLKDCFNR